MAICRPRITQARIAELKASTKAYVAIAVVLICLNLVTLVDAYPETYVVDSGCCAGNQLLAKDFSAFYTAAWRLFHDPSQIYTHGFVNDGEYAIFPQAEQYKYLPSFLIMASPLLMLPYQQALTAFDAVQFVLMPLIALLIYELVKDKGLAVTAGVAVAVLLLPLPLPAPQLSISASYYWQWAEGQSKVLETFLLLLSFYLARSDRPRLAGFTFALAAFDPRFGLLGLPLFIMYSTKLRRSFTYATATFIAANAPLLNPGTAIGFLTMVRTSGLMTPPYYYAFIPILAVVSLMIINREELGLALRNAIPYRWFMPWRIHAAEGNMPDNSLSSQRPERASQRDRSRDAKTKEL